MPDPLEACPSDNALAAYAGHAHGAEASHIEKHLDGCPLCRSVVADLATLALEDRGAAATLPAAGATEEEPISEGTCVGRYVVRARVGAGAMGTVYAAHDPELDREVALKLVRPSLSTGAEGDAFRARVTREARAMARLSHPEVVAVHDVGAFRGSLYIAMELVRGRTLRAWLSEAPRSPAAILDVMRSAGRGLAAAHAAGIVHRDFKPDNVLVGEDGRARVTDFGLARTGAPHDDVHGGGGDPTATVAGAIVGTPVYMAPEQLEGRAADARSDVFAFCVTLHEALYGARPFSGSTPRELVESAKRGVPAAPKGSRVPPRVRRAIVRGLSVDPAARHPRMEALLAELAEPPARRWTAIAAGAALIAGAAIAFGVARRAPLCAGVEAPLATVWSDAKREEVRRAITATGAPYAEETFRGAARALDTWARAYSAGASDACLVHARGEQADALFARRNACLARHLEGARATVDQLARADAEVARRAVQAVEALPSLSECADAAALLAPIPPPSPEIAPRVEALWRRLDQVAAAANAGKYDAALADAEGALADAKALGYEPIHANAAFKRAWLLGRLERLKEHEAALFDALWAAERARDDALIARIWIWLISAAAEQQRFAEAHRNAEHAAAILARSGVSASHAADLDNHLGLLAQAEGKHAEAIARFEKDLAYRERVGAGTYARAAAHRNVAIAAVRLGDVARAQAEIAKAVAIQEEALGPSHPDALSMRNVLAAVLSEEGRHDEAITAFLALKEAQVKALGPEAPAVVATMHNLAVTLMRAGRTDEAIAAFGACIGVLSKQHGEGAFEAAEVRGDLSVALFGAGRQREGATEAARVVGVLESRLGPDHPKVGLARDNLGFMLRALGEIDAAIAEQRRAVAIAEKALGPEDAQVGGALTNLGHDLLAKKQYAEALAAYERAVSILEKRLGASHRALGEPLTGVGRARLAMGSARAAMAPLERALALRENEAPADRAETEEALAEALTKSGGDRARAEALGKAARTRAAKPAAH